MAVIACPSCAKPVVIPDVTLPSNLNDMCRQWPELCATVKTLKESNNIIARNVAEMRNSHPAPTKDFIQGWLDCPDCRPKFEELLKGHPELFTLNKPEVKKFAWER
jgi:hypothetical protein